MKANGIIVGDEGRQALVSCFRSILASLHDFINYEIHRDVRLYRGSRVSLRMTVRSNAEDVENFMRSFIPLEVISFLDLSVCVRCCSLERLISYQLDYWFFLIKGNDFLSYFDLQEVQQRMTTTLSRLYDFIFLHSDHYINRSERNRWCNWFIF